MWKRIAPAVGLFFLAPIVAEFLLGNLPVTMMIALTTLAPMYGGAAVLIREIARRRALGWPGITLLGLAFALLQEAFVTRSLFDPDYAGARLLDYGYLPALGIGAWWTVFVLSLHVTWSVAVPIALVEGLSGTRASTPWLGRIGLAVTGALCALGLALAASFAGSYTPSPWQLAAAGAIVIALVVTALRRAARAERARPDERPAPGPWAVGAAALATGSVFWLGAMFINVLDVVPGTVMALVYLALAVSTAATVARWSRRAGWDGRQRTALAAGALLVYAWHGFPQPPAVPAPPAVDLAGNAVFALGAVILAVAAVRRAERAADARPGGPGAPPAPAAHAR